MIRFYDEDAELLRRPRWDLHWAKHAVVRVVAGLRDRVRTEGSDHLVEGGADRDRYGSGDFEVLIDRAELREERVGFGVDAAQRDERSCVRSACADDKATSDRYDKAVRREGGVGGRSGVEGVGVPRSLKMIRLSAAE